MQMGASRILIQKNKILANGSKSLTQVEQHHSQTEHETLACVFECVHVHPYEKRFTLITDHRALEYIVSNASLERCQLHLQYDMKFYGHLSRGEITDFR